MAARAPSITNTTYLFGAGTTDANSVRVNEVFAYLEQPLDTIEIPTAIADGNATACERRQDVVLYYGVLPCYGRSAPVRRNPNSIRSAQLDLDSKVVMVNFNRVDRSQKQLEDPAEDCLLPPEQMKYHPIRVRFYHLSKLSSVRKLLHHEDEITSTVRREIDDRKTKWALVQSHQKTLFSSGFPDAIEVKTIGKTVCYSLNCL